jgi:hypothetical protein
MRQQIKQIDRRSAASRREYMRQYHARRSGPLPHVSVPAMPRCPPAAGRVILFRADDTVRRHLRDGSGMMTWPERCKTHPETIKETLRRVR